MHNLGWIPWIAAWFLSVTAVCATESCNSPRSRIGRWEAGLSANFLYPNRLPGFDSPATGYGVNVGIPISFMTIRLQGSYAVAPSLVVILSEIAVRFNIPTPYFNGFLTIGPHYLHYTLPDPHDYLGIAGGGGFHLEMANNFGMELGIKVYLQDRNIFAAVAGFNFLL